MATDKPRKPSQTERLLAAYVAAGDVGLTDEEAAAATGLLKLPLCCWWKRCGELRGYGFISATDAHRTGKTGHPRRVSRVTAAGCFEYEGLTQAGVLR